jgi:hypothetical protein
MWPVSEMPYNNDVLFCPESTPVMPLDFKFLIVSRVSRYRPDA